MKYIDKFNKETQINSLLEEFKFIYESSLDQFVPSKLSSTRFSQPWIDRDCKHMSRRKKRAYKKAKLTNSSLDWERFKDLNKKSKAIYKYAYDRFVKNSTSDDIRANPKKFFSFIKSRNCENVGVSVLRDKGKTIIDDSEKAEVLNNHFVSVFSKHDDFTPTLGTSSFTNMRDIIINEKGLLKLLQNIKPYKASGPD
mgnify:FL=1